VQHFGAAILAPEPPEETQESPAVFAFDKPSSQGVAFQVVDSVHMPHASMPVVGGAVAVDMTGACVMHSVARQEVERSELVDAQSPTSQRPAGFVKAADSAVFGPEIRIGRLLPVLV